MPDEFFYKTNESAEPQGPVDVKSLKKLAKSGTLQKDSLIRRGDSAWVVASTVKGLEFTSESVAAPIKPELETNEAAPLTKSSGIQFPDVAPKKASLEIPSGLGKSTSNESKSQPLETPVAKEKKAKPVEKTPEIKIDAPKKAEAPKLDAVQAPVATTKEPELSPKLEKVEPAATPQEPNPFAVDSKAPIQTRPASRGGGGMLSFDTMIAPTVVKVLYYLVLILAAIWWIGFSGMMIVSAVLSGDTFAMATSAGMSIGLLIPAAIYCIMARVMAEVVITFFSLHEEVKTLRQRMTPE